VLSKKQQDIFYQTLGKAIKNARNKEDIKQETLSKYLGFVSRISIANIESGKQKIQLHTLVEISNILKVSLVELLPQIEDMKKDINPKFVKKINISKEIPDEDSETKEKIKNFIRFSTSNNN
jgi:transcriptional regulator with XRE-family HTH domain